MGWDEYMYVQTKLHVCLFAQICLEKWIIIKQMKKKVNVSYKTKVAIKGDN
jgi:hypothetical protein